MKTMRIIIPIALLILLPVFAWAEGADPGYAPVVKIVTGQAASAISPNIGLKASQKVANDALTRSKSAIEKAQSKYNDYLDSLQNAAYIVGELLGIAAEGEVMIENFIHFGKICKAHPWNTLAAAIDGPQIYIDAGNAVVEAFRALRGAIWDSRQPNKLNAAERIELLSRVRPKLTQLNARIARLSIMVRYTSFRYLLGIQPTLPDRNTLYGRAAKTALEKWIDAAQRQRDGWGRKTSLNKD